MCGIVGLITKASYGPTKAEEETFYDMLMVDVLRGDDSTGVILVENDSSFTTMKDQWQPWWFIPEVRESKHGKDMFRKGKAFIGHNRKATVGTVSSATAHPFTVDGVFSMVHNGTLRNHKMIGQHAVDSESLAHLLAPVLGPDYTKEKFEEAIGKVEGAYAVVAYNQLTNKVYMFRNSERPLSLLKTKDAYVFGSELGMVYWCAGRNGMSLQDCENLGTTPHTLYTIDLDTNQLTKEEYVPKKATPVVTTTGNGGKATGKANTGGNVGKGAGGLSKYELKRLRRQFLGTTVEFISDDYVEVNYPRTLAQGETRVNLMGILGDCSFDHYCLGEFDLGKDYDELSLLGEQFVGRVESIDYNKTTGNLTFNLTAIRPVLRHKEVKNEKAATLH